MSQPTRHLSTDGEGCSTTHQPSRVVFAEQRRVAPEFGGPQEARFALELPGDAGQMDTPAKIPATNPANLGLRTAIEKAR